MKTHVGSCHCEAIQFRVATNLDDPARCNCSFCVKRGALLQKVAVERFELTAGAESLSQYGARSFSDHFFCKHCGVHTFTKSSRNGEDAVVINLACLQGLDLSSFEPRVFDGANLL